MAKKKPRASVRKQAARSSAVRPAPDPPPDDGFPIVGVGASAGGYEAFVQLLQSLRSDTNMALVLVMHLEPEHKSLMAKLLSNVTAMQVAEARNGMPVQPRHVYVIPPKSDMGIHQGRLKVVGRKKTDGRYLPVDYFLSSLAEDRHGQAIGVILSGTGSDGTLGMSAIKAEGGITFAQDEETSKHFGMPGSAIASGCIDYVLPPQRIGPELEQLARHPYMRLQGAPRDTSRFQDLPPVGESDFRTLLHLLRSSTGVDFTLYKPGTIRRRIARRMALLKIESLKSYLRHLQSTRGEAEALFQDILIHVTSFFREPEAFKVLHSKIFPKIVASKKPNEPIRFWIPGCSSGEEVYSLAIALLEFLEDQASSTQVQIFGTDISESAIEKARGGVYPESSVRELSPARLRRFFVKSEGGFRVNKSLREMCIFARQDLSKDPPFSRIDLISCRNVLIYMAAALQKRVVAGFHYALREGGFLLLGKSETLTSYSELFAPAERKGRVYTRKVTGARPAPDFSPMSFEKPQLIPPLPDEPAFDALKEADRLVWQRFSHSGLVLNDNLEILHFRGDASPFVSPASGKASLHVLRMIKEELKMELRSALYRARRTNAPVRSTGLRVKHDGGTRELNVEVEPLNRPGGRERYFLVLFDEVPPPSQPALAEKPLDPRRQRAVESRELARLRRELEAAREYLQSVVEQQEAGNEELKSANEEILSSNEELQSTNEELETAKEELQSTNEELVTLNETLSNRNAELAKLSDDLNNVLDAANVPILIVGEDGRIRRFTPSAGALLNLLPSDVGRPLGNIRPNVDIPDLDALVDQVSRTFAELRREVQEKQGRWYSLRIRPYRTAENKIDGVLMAFMDIDDFKRANQALRESEAMVRGLVESLSRAILAIDPAGKVVMVNAAVEAMFGYRRDEMLGQSLEMLLPDRYRNVHRRLRINYFTDPHVRIMSGGREIAGRRKDGTEFPLEASLSYIGTGSGALAVAFVTDMTERREVERLLDEKEKALQASQLQLQMLTASLLSAQEEERQRLAGELHDDLTQRLTAISLKAASLEKQLPPAHAVRSGIASMRTTVEQLSEDVRHLAHQLHPSILEHFGLAKAIASYSDEFGKLKGIKVRFRHRNVPPSIPQDIALCLYRVTQECLSNTAKHAGTSSVAVHLEGAAGRVYLAIADEGVGFDAKAAAAQPGLGMISMRERVRIAGGTLSIKAQPGVGSRVEVSIPLP